MVRQAQPHCGRPRGEYVGCAQARVVDVEVVDDGRDRRAQLLGRFHRGKVLDLRCERRHGDDAEHVRVGALDFVGRFAAVPGGSGEATDASSQRNRILRAIRVMNAMAPEGLSPPDRPARPTRIPAFARGTG